MKCLSVQGIISAGKSTLVNNLELELTRLGKTVLSIQEPVDTWIKNGYLAMFYKDPKRWGYFFQGVVLQTRVKSINDSVNLWRLHNNGNYPDYIILDRSPESDQLFATLLHDSGDMTDEEFDVYSSWKNIWEELLCVRPTITVYLNPDLEVCMDRLKKRNRKEEDPVNIDYQKKLHNLHDKMFKNRDGVIEVKKTDLENIPDIVRQLEEI